MKDYLKSFRGIFLALALVVGVTFFGTILSYRMNRLNEHICEEDLIDGVEPEGIKEENIL